MAEEKFAIPARAEKYLESLGYTLPNRDMSPHIGKWERLYRSEGEFWDYEDSDGSNMYKMHRRSVRPFKRVCVEWSNLILGDKTYVSAEDERCTAYLDDTFREIGFFRNCQSLVQRTFGLGTGCMAPWFDSASLRPMVRRYDARMMVPLSWDDDGVREIALCSTVVAKGEPLTQLQTHILEADGYHIRTVYFDKHGDIARVEGVIEDFPTHDFDPWFAVVRPAIDNDLVYGSPYGVSVFKDAIDALESVDLSFDAIMTEVDLGKLRIFMADSMFELETKDGEVSHFIPFGKTDATIYRRTDSVEGGPISTYAPALRIEAQQRAYRLSLQTMGDLCGFGLNYFDIDESGGLKTATEVSADNSQLMRNLRNHESIIQGAVETVAAGVLKCAEAIGEKLPEPGKIEMRFDDSIITDTASEKAQDMQEVAAGIMQRWEYRAKWYGESEEEAKRNSSIDVFDMGD